MPHTPGPWQAKLGRSMAFDVSIVNDEGHIVARTSESNGPLIAATPDLLAALQEAHDTITQMADFIARIPFELPEKDHLDACDSMRASGVTREAIRAAIAKTTEAPR